MTTKEQTRSIGGTVFHDGKPRILSIKGIKIDAEFTPSMIYVTNEDKPGFIGRFASVLGDAGVNIATFALGRDEEGGSAIALVSIDGEAPAGGAGARSASSRACGRRPRCISEKDRIGRPAGRRLPDPVRPAIGTVALERDESAPPPSSLPGAEGPRNDGDERN